MMNKAMRAVVPGAMALWVVSSVPATAGTLFDSSQLLGNSYVTSEASWVSPFDTAASDIFDVGTSISITGIEWWGLYTSTESPSSDLFSVTLTDDDSGNSFVGGAVSWSSSGKISEGLLGGYTLYKYSIEFAEVVLPEAEYTLTIQNDTGAARNVGCSGFWDGTSFIDGGCGWNWVRGGGPGTSAPGDDNGMFWDGSDWAESGSGMRFNLTAVPEPATIALLGLGLAGIGFRAGKKRR